MTLYMAIESQNNKPQSHVPAALLPGSTLSGFPGQRTANLDIGHEQQKMQRYQMAKPESHSLLEDGQSEGAGQVTHLKGDKWTSCFKVSEVLPRL